MNQIKIYTTPYLDSAYDLDRIDAKVISLPIQKMGKSFVETGGPYDICIMPHVAKYNELLSIFRNHGKTGPVIFVANAFVDPAVVEKMAEKGAILADLRYERSEFIRQLIQYFMVNPCKCDESSYEDFNEVIGKAKKAEREEPTSFSGKQGKTVDRINTALGVGKFREEIPIDQFVKKRSSSNDEFTLSFEVISYKDLKKLPLHCMARLFDVREAYDPLFHYRFVFHRFFPAFAFQLLEEMCEKTSPEMIANLLTTPKKMKLPDHTVQFVYNSEAGDRTCIMLPASSENGMLELIPLSGFFLQKRRFFRVVPPPENPMTALISSSLHPTRKINVIDVSESGLSFLSSQFLPVNCDISIYMHWNNGDIVCRGVTRSLSQSNIKNQDKIGAEIFPHKNELDKLKMYMFNCQLSTFKSLRTGRIQ